MNTIEHLKATFPRPSKLTGSNMGGYCVGTALCYLANFPTKPYPYVMDISYSLSHLMPGYGLTGNRMEEALRLVELNDEGDFAGAWTYLEEILGPLAHAPWKAPQ